VLRQDMQRIDADIELHEIPEAGCVRLAVSGPVDLATAGLLHHALDDVTRRDTDAVIDLSGVTAIDPCGLRVLLDAEAHPGRTRPIAGAPPHACRITEQVGLPGRLSFAA